MELSLREKLCFCTTRIEAQIDDKKMSYGTGFFFNFQASGDRMIPVIITNKHVACGKRNLTFYLSKQDGNGNPIFLAPIKLTLSEIELKNSLFEHPDPEIDLCAVAINPLINKAKSIGFTPFYRTFTANHIPTKEDLDKLDGIEEVQMIGYPNALWDKQHNMPLVRKGITATWPKLDFNGKREFLIDAACFPGSSGSPVIICDMGLFYSKEKKDTIIGNRFMLLGIQYSVPIRTAEGVIVKKTLDEIGIDIEKEYTIKTETMLNLGYVITAECILDIIPVIESRI